MNMKKKPLTELQEIAASALADARNFVRRQKGILWDLHPEVKRSVNEEDMLWELEMSAEERVVIACVFPQLKDKEQAEIAWVASAMRGSRDAIRNRDRIRGDMEQIIFAGHVNKVKRLKRKLTPIQWEIVKSECLIL